MQLVMIVEDEDGNAEVLQRLFEASGYRVALAANGELALAAIAGEKPALIVSDFMMPRMNGAQLGAAVRADPAWRDIPFVFVSGSNKAVVTEQFADYDAFIGKPCSFDDMLRVLEPYVTHGRSDVRRGPDAAVRPCGHPTVD